MPAKKVVFIIVEGPSDEDALGVIFERFFEKNTVHVKVIHGDITTERQINSTNIVNHITSIVKQTLSQYKLHKSDLLKVIHLVDTDGAFVPNMAIVYDEHATKPFYSTTQIITDKPEAIIQRNQRKKANLTKLYSTRLIWQDIPYSVYYLSCNLDHALYNALNLSDEEKEKKAVLFAKEYIDNIPSFIEYVRDPGFAVINGYIPSWAFIKQGLHSLERYTNIGLCFSDEESSEKNMNDE
jgi:hypothetical protein